VTDDVITWVFDEDSFSPVAKLRADKKYSILSDYLGTPTHVFNDGGEVIWEAALDSYGKLRVEKGTLGSCPFRYQGQYEDFETGLYYNRFRYYDCGTGVYISQDPIELLGGSAFYEYVKDPNIEYDLLGLATYHKKNGQFGKKRGRPKKKDNTHGNSVHSQKPRQHYVIVDQHGVPYHGVGDVKGKRAKQSLARLQNDPNNAGKKFEIKTQTNHSNSMGAVKGEARGIRDTGGAGPNNPRNYNNINSPGAPFI
jgi:RHS repeat-associated protein